MYYRDLRHTNQRSQFLFRFANYIHTSVLICLDWSWSATTYRFHLDQAQRFNNLVLLSVISGSAMTTHSIRPGVICRHFLSAPSWGRQNIILHKLNKTTKIDDVIEPELAKLSIIDNALEETHSNLLVQLDQRVSCSCCIPLSYSSLLEFS